MIQLYNNGLWGEYQMDKKELLDRIRARVPDEKLNTFVEVIRAAKSPEERAAILDEYGVGLSEDEKEQLRRPFRGDVPDTDLDQVIRELI